jgi:hypothetical protein
MLHFNVAEEQEGGDKQEETHRVECDAGQNGAWYLLW